MRVKKKIDITQLLKSTSSKISGILPKKKQQQKNLQQG